ncbi:hypothetical protein [Spirosoma sp.]|uniref:hypothetical protein n=1 Tax=Spirosoma sp. TaxID=1899569 RepID=UPI0026111F0A|nr:hypothetical protein [Spirosoma sp.]MCX6218295.1 hypothetical protein [Spirosoma sp.]
MRDSIFETLTIRQIDDLIHQEELEQQGYSFYCTPDLHEISKYCYPFGIDSTLTENGYTKDGYSVSYISDQFIALSRFFDTNNIFLLLDEYQDELRELRNKIIENLFKRIKFHNDYKTFSDYLFSNSGKDIKNDFGLLISAASGVLQQGAQRYNSFVGEKLIVNYEEFDRIVSEFAALKPIEYAFEMSKNSREAVVERLMKAFSKKRDNRKVAIEADCKAIDRICQINNTLIENQEKYLLLFLSSTDTSRDVYFNDDINIIDYPVIGKKAFHFHRTSAQIFIQTLLREDNDIKATLVEIRKIVSKRVSDSDKAIATEFEEAFNERINILRNRYAHENLLKQLKDFERLFNRLNEAEGNYRHLSKLFKELQEQVFIKGVDALEDTSKGILGTIDFELEFHQHYNKWLRSKPHAKDKPSFLIQRGNDYVFGTGHHLPLLFKNGGDQKELIKKIVTQYIIDEVESLQDKEEFLEEKIRELIISNVQESFNAQGKPGPEDILVRCLLNIIIPTDRKKGLVITPEFVVINVAEKQLPLIENDSNHKELLGDYYYLLCWVCRRNLDYKKSEYYAHKGIASYPEDPRFSHGLFLYHYCKFRDYIPTTSTNLEGDTMNAKLHLEQGLESAFKALTNYNLLLVEEPDNIVLIKTKAALMTGIIVAFAYLYAISQDENKLTNSRNIITELKEFEGSGYDQQPEYKYVESFLEYQEYCSSVMRGEPNQSKLQYALTAIKEVHEAVRPREEYAKWYTSLKLFCFEKNISIVGN